MKQVRTSSFCIDRTSDEHRTRCAVANRAIPVRCKLSWSRESCEPRSTKHETGLRRAYFQVCFASPRLASPRQGSRLGRITNHESATFHGSASNEARLFEACKSESPSRTTTHRTIRNKRLVTRPSVYPCSQ